MAGLALGDVIDCYVVAQLYMESGTSPCGAVATDVNTVSTAPTSI